jgi:AraC-like DNA-binding protein
MHSEAWGHRQERHGDERVYGDAVARSLGIRRVPALRTRSLGSAQIGLTRISCGATQLGMTPEIPAEDSFVMALYLTELAHHELWSRGRRTIAQGYRPDAMRIVNLEARYSALITAPHETVCVYLPRAALDGLAAEAGLGRVADLVCPPGVIDPVVANLGAALLPSFEQPAETSQLFVDQIAIALSSHLLYRYGAAIARRRHASAGGLSLGKERRAKEYLAARFGEDVAVADVAAACALSRGHFLRAFKATTGCTPHKWLQHYRIEQAKRMLASPAASIAEVALKCGFADQSHMTRVFTQIAGISPAAWRRNNRDRLAGED